MLALAFSVSLFLAAPSADAAADKAQLIGTWVEKDGSAFLTLNGDGTGKLGTEEVKWTVEGNTLKVVSSDGETREMDYRLEKGKLVVQIEEAELKLTKQGAARPTSGKKKH